MRNWKEIAPWISRILGLVFMAGVAYAALNRIEPLERMVNDHDKRIAVVDNSISAVQRQLDRIESKLDRMRR